MKLIISALAIFIVSVFVIEMGIYAYRALRYPNRSKIRKRLKASSSVDDGAGQTDILKKRRTLSEVPVINTFLWFVPGIERLDRMLQQSNVNRSLGFFVLLSAVLAMSGYMGVSIVTRNTTLSLIVAAALGMVPALYVRAKRRERMQKFQKQLPDALDLIARALQAGHAFTSGMKLAAEEFEDPLGTEFNETLDEINFGVSVPDALRNLAGRVDCLDLRYFIVSVILQRETGGNLAEIIQSIAYIIRERFKLRGKIRVLSAEGRLSAVILSAIPLLIIIALRFINPEYHTPLFAEPAGRIMAGLAGFLMLFGMWCMKRMVNIRV